jgi:isoquinoline 1-oxidoreductase beta subunit
MEPMNCTVHVRKDGCEIWIGSQAVARVQAAAAKTAGLPLDKVVVHNHLIGGGFGRRLEADGAARAVQIAQHVDGPVKVVWTREEDIQHDMYRPHWFDRISAGLDAKGMPVAWNNRFAGSSVASRWASAWFKNGLDPDSTEGAIDLVYALPNMHVEYVRVEPPGIPTAFWRSVGPSHNVFVTESFIDELAAAAKQDPVAYRLALLDKNPRAKAVLALAAEKAGWGQPLPDRVGRGVSLQFVFATYMAQVAEVEVGKDGAVRVRRVVCAVDCGTVVNPDTVRAQIQSGIIFGITAALYGKITLKDGRVEQTNFDTYQILRMDQAPAIDVHIVQNFEPPGGRGRDFGHRSGSRQRDLCGDRQAPAQDASRRHRIEAAGVKRNPDSANVGHGATSGSGLGISIQMLLEKRERQRQRPLRLRLRVGLAAVAREGMIGTGIFVDRHQRIG